MPNYNAPAELHRFEMSTSTFGSRINPGPRFLRAGSFVEFANFVMAKREPDAHLYSITTGLEAGFQKTEFRYQDIVKLYNEPDFPRAKPE
jgi:hypothetical protein